MKTININASQVVAAPLDKVWDIIADVDNDPKYYSGLTDNSWLLFTHSIFDLSANGKSDRRTSNESGSPIKPQIAKEAGKPSWR